VERTTEQAIARALDAHPEIVFAYLHGSIVHGPAARDIDIAVYVQPDLLPERSFAYEDALEQEIQTTAASSLPIDVRIMNRAPIPFQYQAIKGRLIRDRDPDSRSEISSWIVSRYLDLKPILDHHLKEAFSRDTEH
jgi:hypothetical protein